MFTTYKEWSDSVVAVYNNLDACRIYLNEAGERRRSQFGVLMSVTWMFYNAADALEYIKCNSEFKSFSTLKQPIRYLEKLAIIEGGKSHDKN